MEIYLLKFSACLLVFWLAYILFLERQKMHYFKRFYLLSALALALVIPTLTITEYIKPVVANFETTPVFIPMESFVEMPIEETPFLNLETTLWLIYIFGGILFLFRFVINLIKINRRISKNKNITKRSFIYVLLRENLIPHSFFKYIFLNKTQYESNNIPKEVMLHEETHAEQLHSLDIIIIELLQIVFWFHPMIYILKHHIKLNHEFLADQAVLKIGTDTKTYQNILLQFSSSTNEYQLSSTINYSSIKKRFTVMKTQTSKTRMWLSTLLVLPIIAILFYSFAERVEVGKEIPKQQITEKQVQPIMVILINKLGQLLIDDKKGSMASIESKLKSLSTSSSTSKAVLVKYYMNDISNKVFKDVKTLIRKYDFKVIQVDASSVSTPPQPPAKQQKSKGSPNTNDYQHYLIPPQIPENATFEERKKMQLAIDSFEKKHKIKIHTAKNNETGKLVNFIVNDDVYEVGETSKTTQKKTIKPVEILIKKDNRLVLNGKPIKFKDLAGAVTKINQHLTIEERRSYVYATILMEANESVEYSKNVELELKKADIWYSSLSYLQNQKSIGLSTNKLWTFNDLTIKEAKEKREKLFNYSKGSEQNKKNDKASPWSIETGINYVKYVEDSEQKQGPIEVNGKTYYYAFQNGKTMYYNRFGKEVKLENSSQQTPSNPSFLEFIENMEKQGATFYLDDQKITSAEAKSIASTNKGKNTELITQKDTYGKYVVKLSKPQQKPTVKQISEYNAWAKRMNVQNEGMRIIKKKNLDKYKHIYSMMSATQRNNAEPFPQLPPPPPPTKAPQYKNDKKKTLNDIIKETPNGVESGYELLENGESHFYTVHKGEKTYYNKDGYITDKKGEVLPPPPPAPPAPESTLDFVIRMAKANAKFFNEGKYISSDKAIALIKKNPKLNVNAKEKSKNGKPLVYIVSFP